MSERPVCDTPGCGREIPIGGEGHPEICPVCLDQEAVDPAHYNSHPSGVEAITVCEHMNFCRGNAMKYLWRAGHKGDELEDLKKARWYIDREIQRLEGKR
jgi:hypothetical protein